MSSQNFNEQSVAECLGQMAKSMARLLLKFDDGKEMLADALSFDDSLGTLTIRMIDPLDGLTCRPLSAYGVGDAGEFKFNIDSAVMDAATGHMHIATPETIQTLPRRRALRVCPNLMDAPELYLINHGHEFEVSVLDITHEGVRIMVQSSEWENEVSRSGVNQCRINIPGAGEYIAGLEVRHYKATDSDRLDSPIEIGCRFHNLTPQGVDSLKNYCLKISQKA